MIFQISGNRINSRCPKVSNDSRAHREREMLTHLHDAVVGSLDRHSISSTELIAAGEAMNKNEFFDVQGLKEWSFFTAHEHLTFFTGELLDGECVEDYSQDTIGEGEEREVASFDPVSEEEGVREYLKGKWDVIPVEDR